MGALSLLLSLPPLDHLPSQDSPTASCNLVTEVKFVVLVDRFSIKTSMCAG